MGFQKIITIFILFKKKKNFCSSKKKFFARAKKNFFARAKFLHEQKFFLLEENFFLF
jgi:hypothetical protein